MTQPIEGPDVHFWPLEVTSDTHRIGLEEDTDGDGALDSKVDTTIATGTKYAYRGNGAGPSSTVGLYDALETALNSLASENTYAIEAATPDGSQITYSGVRIRATNASPAAFRVRWDFVDGLDPRWLGWGAGSTTSPTSSSHAPADSVESPYTIYGQWRPVTAFSQNTATLKDWDRRAHLESSGNDPIHDVQIEHGTPTEIRPLTYSQVPATCIRGGRGQDATYADLAGLAAGDTHNGLDDWHDAVGRGRKQRAIVLHNEADRADHDLDVSADDVELGYLHPKKTRSMFSDVRSLESKNPELYNIEFKLALTSSDISFG